MLPRRPGIFLPSLLALVLLLGSIYEWRRSVWHWDSLEIVTPWFGLLLQSEEAAGIVTVKRHSNSFWDIYTDTLPVEGEPHYVSPIPLSLRSTADGLVLTTPFLHTTLVLGVVFVLLLLWDVKRWRARAFPGTEETGQ